MKPRMIMNKQQLHEIRRQISDLFYLLFDSLEPDKRGAFVNLIASIDYQIKSFEEF